MNTIELVQNNSKAKAILAINPTASNDYFRQRMKDIGLNVIGFFTTIDFPGYSNNALRKEHYLRRIISNGSITDDLHGIQKLSSEIELIHGMIGTEVGVEYGQLLLSILFPQQSNHPETSHLHYKKFEMNERLRSCGVPSLQQIMINAKLPYADIEKSILSVFPLPTRSIVLKPSHGSAASKDVLITSSVDEVHAYFHKKEKGLFYQTDDIVVQELAMGDEYFVDGYSYQGQHQFTSVFKYTKQYRNGSMIYRYKDILADEDSISREARSYVAQCLDALKYQFGFSHTEIIRTQEGYRLIEMNPRISGAHGSSNDMAKLKNNVDQIDLYANSMLSCPLQKVTAKKCYRYYYLNNVGFSFHGLNMKMIESLTSYHSIKILKHSGHSCCATQFLTDTVALILLAHDEFQQIEEDTNKLMRYENNGTCFLKS